MPNSTLKTQTIKCKTLIHFLSSLCISFSAGRDMDMSGDEVSRQVQARFVTKLKDPFKVPNSVMTIPAYLNRLGLSAVVNGLILSGNADWKHEPFDFLINGELVRMSLEEFLLAKGISAEKTLEIEYIRAVAPRREEEPSLHDDWISAVDGTNSEFVMTGCYDGLVRIWRAAGSCSHILEGHSAAVTSVSIANPKGMKNTTDTVVASASKDRTLRLWKFNMDETTEQPTTVRAYKILRGHNAAVQSVAAKPSGDMVCSGSWDCRINLWDAKESGDGGDLVSTKKRRKEDEKEEFLSEGAATSTLVGHTQCVSSVIWPQNDTIYSASWDHLIKRWDVETGQDTANLISGKVINCLDVGGESNALVAAGGSDPILRIWDPRKPGNLAPIFNFSSHTSWISSVKWHNKSWFHLVTASYDGKVMIWDLRTAWPVAVIEPHQDKVLCADWWRGDSVVSGGADSKLCISSEVGMQ